MCAGGRACNYAEMSVEGSKARDFVQMLSEARPCMYVGMYSMHHASDIASPRSTRLESIPTNSRARTSGEWGDGWMVPPLPPICSSVLLEGLIRRWRRWQWIGILLLMQRN